MGKRVWTRCKAFLKAHLLRKGQEASQNSDPISSTISCGSFVRGDDDDNSQSVSQKQQDPKASKRHRRCFIFEGESSKQPAYSFPHVPLEIRDLIIEYLVMVDILTPWACPQCPGSVLKNYIYYETETTKHNLNSGVGRYSFRCFEYHESRTTYFRILEYSWSNKADLYQSSGNWHFRWCSFERDYYRRLMARLLNLMLLDKATLSSILVLCSRCLIPAMEQIMLADSENVEHNIVGHNDQHIVFYSMYVWLRNLCLYEQRLSGVPLSRRRLTPVKIDSRDHWSDHMIVKSLHEPEESHI